MWTKTDASHSDSKSDERERAAERARHAMDGLVDHVSWSRRRELGVLEEQVAQLGASCPRELLVAQDEARTAADALVAHLAAVRLG